MKGPKQNLTFGYPPETYTFTEKYQLILQGFYKAFRNKRTVCAPIYANNKGKSLIDMTQVRGVNTR